MNKKNLFIFFFFFCGLLTAQEPLHLTVKDGLPSNHVYDVLEDKDGFIWFATNRGVVKYNGESFKTFTIKDGLPNNDIWLLDRDHKDNLWYFSKSKYQGFIRNDSVYKFKTEKDKVISPFVYKTDTSFSILWEDVYQLEKDALKIIHEDIKFRSYDKIRLKYGIALIFGTNDFKNNFLCLTKDKIVLVNKDGVELKKSKLVIKLNSNEISKISLKRNDIYYNNLLVIQSKKGFLSIDKTSLNQKHYSYKELGIKEATAISRSKIIDNKIQITLDNNLLIFDKNFNFIKKHSLTQEVQFSRAFKDSKENIWMVGNNGVHLMSKQQLTSNYFLKDKLTKKIGVINNQLLLGVEKDAIYKIDNNKVKKVPELDLSGEKLYQLENNKVVTVYNSYVYVDKEYKSLKFKTKDDHYLSFKDYVIFRDSIYLISGVDATKFSLKTKLGKILFRKSGLLEVEVFKNEVYYGGADGFWLLKNDSLIRSQNHNLLLEANINSIEKNGDFLYIATDGRGVYLYNKNEMIHLKNTDGLIVQKILKQNDKLWLATQKGVVEVTLNNNNLESSKITNRFLQADGLLQNNVNDIYIKDSSLYALSDVGAVKLNINDKVYKELPSLSFVAKNDKTILKKLKDRNTSVTFGSLSFTNQENIIYQYRLLPEQKEWKATASKTINLSSLSPKTYQLEVKATDQHFNTTTKAHTIIVLAAWYETFLAKTAYILLSFLGIYFLFKLNQKRVKEKEKEKSKREKRIAGLELQALRSQMNPHFVHNSLNAIQYYIQRNEVEQSENYLAKFSKLIREFFEYSRRQYITVAEEVSLLENYLTIEKLRFEDKLTYQVKVDENIDAEDQILPSMILQPIVENAVNHGLFHKKGNGTVNVFFEFIDKNTFKVSVKDDGIGIKKAKEIQEHSTKNYQSHSSTVLEERIELLNQSNDWNIDFSIEDNNTSNQTGTIVSIVFKQSFL